MDYAEGGAMAALVALATLVVRQGFDVLKNRAAGADVARINADAARDARDDERRDSLIDRLISEADKRSEQASVLEVQVRELSDTLAGCRAQLEIAEGQHTALIRSLEQETRRADRAEQVARELARGLLAARRAPDRIDEIVERVIGGTLLLERLAPVEVSGLHHISESEASDPEDT